MDPHEITPGSTDPSLAGPSVDPSNVPPATPALPDVPASDDGPEVKSSLLDPALDRMGPPVGAARFIPADRTHAPSFVFLIVVSVVTLASDLGSKFWAEKNLDSMPSRFELWKDHVGFVLAQNRGGAWGLLQSTNENVRRPFFLLVSAAAIAFIVTLYRRLLPTQRALKWGLPLVLGGALGNVFDRIRYGHVIDFIDVHMLYKDKDHHWPTFNVADIAICVGVGLMAIDMFTSKRPRRPSSVALEPVPDTAISALSGEPTAPPAPLAEDAAAPAIPSTEEALPASDAEDAPPAAKPTL
ncbi:MAG: Lipoprotein signal peptidase [Myxococcaceae bacterium]|nr:Lipoprotein signal peptidase [Myxococcaceae bacterium]